MSEKRDKVFTYFVILMVGVMIGVITAFPLSTIITHDINQDLIILQNKVDLAQKQLLNEYNINEALTDSLNSVKIEYNYLSTENSKLKTDLQQLQSDYASLYNSWLELKGLLEAYP